MYLLSQDSFNTAPTPLELGFAIFKNVFDEVIKIFATKIMPCVLKPKAFHHTGVITQKKGACDTAKYAIQSTAA